MLLQLVCLKFMFMGHPRIIVKIRQWFTNYYWAFGSPWSSRHLRHIDILNEEKIKIQNRNES
jgi:hypothetical protein